MEDDWFTFNGRVFRRSEYPELFPPSDPLPTTYAPTKIDEVVSVPMCGYNWFLGIGRFGCTIPYIMHSDNEDKLGTDVWRSIEKQKVRVVGSITEKAELKIDEIHILGVIGSKPVVWARRLLTEAEKELAERDMKMRQRRNGQ